MKLCRDPPAYITHRFRYNSTNYNCCFSKAQLYLFHYFERAHGSSSTGICGPAGTSAGSCSRMLTAISMACTQCSETRFFIFCKQKRPKTFSLRCAILTDYKLKKKRTCKWALMKRSLRTCAAEKRFCWFLCTKLKNDSNLFRNFCIYLPIFLIIETGSFSRKSSSCRV